MLTCRTHGDLVSGLYHQILLSLQKVLSDPVRPLCSHYGAVVGLHALGWKVNTDSTTPTNTNMLFTTKYHTVCVYVFFDPGCWTCAVSSPPCLLGESTSCVRWLLCVQRSGESRRPQSLWSHFGKYSILDHHCGACVSFQDADINLLIYSSSMFVHIFYFAGNHRESLKLLFC